MAVGHLTGADGPAGCGASRVRPSPRAAPSVTPATPAFRAHQPLEEVLLCALDHHGDALATADAHSRNAQLHVAARHLVQERGENACPAGTDRMAQAMAPPLTLTLSSGTASSRHTATD